MTTTFFLTNSSLYKEIIDLLPACCHVLFRKQVTLTFALPCLSLSFSFSSSVISVLTHSCDGISFYSI